MHICENKGSDLLRGYHLLRGYRAADQWLCFRYIVHLLYFLNPKFQAFNRRRMRLYIPVCVMPDLVEKSEKGFQIMKERERER